nr:ARID DNA-binding domain-containing protein [Tanacetum cinerariifolium]
MNSHNGRRNWKERFPAIINSEHWHQSLKPRKYRTKPSQMEFVQRKIKREREGFGPCAPQITKECKAMLRNKIEQINLFNSTLSSNKFRNYACFYYTQKGHVAKSCPTKLSDERLYAQAGSMTFKHGDEATRARIRKNKETKQLKETAAAIPSLLEPKVSIKYIEFVHFRTRGIIDGTDKGSWDEFWYISNTSNKHMTANLKFFLNFKEEFTVEPLEEQGKFLFTYGIGEVLIENGDRTSTIPGVHYTPEVTLNILSLGLLRQQGFEISSNGDRFTLAYMFKDRRGKNINLDRMREQHNNYLEDYFDALDRSVNIERKIEQPYEKKDDDVEIGNFHECVAFLDLIRKGRALSNEWDVHRDKFNRVLTWFFNHFLMRPFPGSLPPIIKGVSIHLFDLYELIECMGGYISVQFEGDFEGLAEHGHQIPLEDMKMKALGASRITNEMATRMDQRLRRKKEESSISGLPSRRKRKASVTQLHIRIKKTWQGSSAIYVKRRDTSTCPNENQRPTNEASTSRPIKEEDTQSISSGDFTIIT